MLRTRVTKLGLQAGPQRGLAEGFSHPPLRGCPGGRRGQACNRGDRRGGQGERHGVHPFAGTAGAKAVYPPPSARKDLPAALLQKVPERQTRSPPARGVWPAHLL